MLRVAAAAAAAHAARHAPAASSRGIFALCAPRRAADRRFASRLTRPPPAAQDGAGGRQPGVRGVRGAAAAAAAARAQRCFERSKRTLTLPACCMRRHTALTRSGTLMGEDSFGNKYYENMSYQAGARGGRSACCRLAAPGVLPRALPVQRLTRARRAGRHRWVVFADAHNYSARSVPREWHGAPLCCAKMCIAARSLSASPHAWTLRCPLAQAGCTR